MSSLLKHSKRYSEASSGSWDSLTMVIRWRPYAPYLYLWACEFELMFISPADKIDTTERNRGSSLRGFRFERTLRAAAIIFWYSEKFKMFGMQE